MIGKKMCDLMNEQIKNELESYYIYLSMVAYFHSRNLDGMAHWMRCQAHEEMIHAMKFYDHIIDRGGTVELLNLKQLKTKWKSPLEAWQDTLEHEKFITAKIHDLVNHASHQLYAAILLDLPTNESAWMVQPLRVANTVVRLRTLSSGPLGAFAMG